MPRRLALALVALLLLLLGALLAGRGLGAPPPAAPLVPPLRPTAAIPPTPIPARRVSLYFESPNDDQLHPEARDVPAALDDVAFLRSVAGAVMDGPRRPELVKPFPEGWSLRGAYLLREGIAVVDLSPPPLAAPKEPGTPAGPRWSAGSHEEDTAIQAPAVTLPKNPAPGTRHVRARRRAAPCAGGRGPPGGRGGAPRRMPFEDLLYLGDTARLPYGTKSPETVRRYARRAIGFLLAQGVKAVVVACNPASALALDAIEEMSPVPVVCVVAPGAEAAVAAARASDRDGMRGGIAGVATGG